MLLTDVGKYHHVVTLSLAHGPHPPSTKTPRGYLHDAAQKLHRPNFFPGVDESKPHRLWPAKKIAAFFNTSLSSRRSRTSLRSRVFSFSTSSCGPDIKSSCFFSGYRCAMLCQTADVAELTCSASKAPHQNLMNAAAVPLIETAFQLPGSGSATGCGHPHCITAKLVCASRCHYISPS